MKKRIFNNIGLKILALLIAVLVWWAVMNIDDPLVKKTITGISVELRNEKELTGKGYIYEVVSGSTISITVWAPDSVAKDLKAADFVAYADLSQLSPLTDSANIEIECVKSDIRNDIKDISSKTQVVKLSIDNKQSADIAVAVDISGTPAEGYVIGDSSISQNKIQVTGAASIVETIAKAVVAYDVSNMMQSVSEMVAPVFYDENGNVVNTSSLQISRNTLRLSVEIQPTKWVPVTVVPSVTAADGYKVTGYFQNLDTVNVAGTADSLADLSVIAIPGDAIVIDNVTESLDYSVNIANYLKGSYRIVSDTSELIVHINVEPLIDKKYIINNSGIAIYNVGDNLEAEIEDSSIEVRIKALKIIHDYFNVDSLNSYIDLKGYEAGEYEIQVIMSEDTNSYELIDKPVVKVVITEVEEESSQEEGESSTEEGESPQEENTSKEESNERSSN